MYAIDMAGHGRILYSSYTGCYSSNLKEMKPKPDVAILGVPARLNLDGYPYQGTKCAVSRKKCSGLSQRRYSPYFLVKLIGGCVLFEGWTSGEAVWSQD
jgi:hypothetical protein